MTELRSGAGWSTPSTEDTEAFETPPRYEWQDVLGSGGMGTVHAVHDTLLGRDVAMKQVRTTAASRGARELLTWEAWITARLEHPAIVPVYDAGETPEGHRFFTMRLVRGRALSEILRDESSALPTLLRAFLTVCEAVAYAHAHGVVHRDLKPENVMLGAFGEVQVVDWGLAGFLGPIPDGVVDPALRRVGTPGFAAPEQLEGSAPDPRADVYGLGVTLRALLEHIDAADALEAIVRKAIHAAPTQRYPSAAELAHDVERFLDGRAVEAHAYTPLQTLARIARAYRRPLGLLAVALVAGGLALVSSYRTLLEEERRARVAEAAATRAEAETRQSLLRAERSLGHALEAQAVAALAAGAEPEAEVLAVAALRHGESARARGVLAAAHAGPRPRATRTTVRGCRRIAFDHEGFACLDDAEVRWHPTPDAPAAWRIPFDAEDARFGDDRVVLRGATAASVRSLRDGTELARLEAEFSPSSLMTSPDGGHVGAGFRTRLLVHTAEGQSITFAPCARVPIHAMAVGDGHVALACGRGDLHVRDLATGVSRRHRVPFGDALLPAFAMAFAPGDVRLALGGIGGEVLVIDPLTGEGDAPFPVAERPIAGLAFLGDRLVVRPDGGVARLVRLDAPEDSLRLPLSATRGVDVRGGLVSDAGATRWAWEVPPQRPSVFRADAGLSSASFATEWVALARGDGVLSVRAWSDGRHLADLPLAPEVLKRVATSADERHVYVAIASARGAARIATDTWRVEAYADVDRALRRVAFLGPPEAERVVALDYGRGLSLGDPTANPDFVPIPQSIDLAVSRDRSTALLLGRDGQLRRFVPGHALEDLGSFPFAESVAEGDDVIAIGFRDRIRVLPSGRELDPRGEIGDVVFSADGRWLAAGGRDGAARVWSTSTWRLVARLEGATERISWVGFAPDGRLATASWDGTLRLYDLRVLDRTPEDLADDAEATWRITLEEVLESRALAADEEPDEAD
ncbi:MAG: protein kinase [Sandaracinus sp.]|nr:protein kinase [Sandaracinus sp.]